MMAPDSHAPLLTESPHLTVPYPSLSTLYTPHPPTSPSSNVLFLQHSEIWQNLGSHRFPHPCTGNRPGCPVDSNNPSSLLCRPYYPWLIAGSCLSEIQVKIGSEIWDHYLAGAVRNFELCYLPIRVFAFGHLLLLVLVVGLG